MTVQVLGYLAAGPWLPGQAAPAAELREQRFINVVKHASIHTPDAAARLGWVANARPSASALWLTVPVQSLSCAI